MHRQGQWWRHRLRGFQQNAVCERARRTRGGVCVGQEGRARVAGLSLRVGPFVPPLFPRFTYIYCIYFFFLTLSLSGFWTGRGHRCRPFFPRFLPSIFIAHTSRVQQSHCSSIFHQVLLTHALAPSVSQFVHKKKSPRICTSVHSAGLELTKLTYTRLEDNLIRHRGDRTYVYVGCASCLWLSSGSCCVPKGCGNDCSEGIRNMTARSSMHAI